MIDPEPVRWWISGSHCKDCRDAYQYNYRYNDIFNFSKRWMRIHKRRKLGGWRERNEKRGYHGPEIRWWITPHHCKRCMASYDWQKNHGDIFWVGRGFHREPDYLENRERRRYAKRMEALRAYSSPVPFCACCQENEFEFLCVDHIENNGAEHRKEIGRGALYLWLRKHNYPPGFQVLCFNCNEAKRMGTICPHKRTA